MQRNRFSRTPFIFCNGCFARIQSLRVGQGSDSPVTANHYLYRVQLCQGALQLSLGTFRREPATRRFDESFAPTRRSAERFARQYPFGPPPGFPPASPCPRVGHRLSGSRTTARTPDLAPAVHGGPWCGGFWEGRAAGLPVGSPWHVSLSLRVSGIEHPTTRSPTWLLGPCFKTGPTTPRDSMAAPRRPRPPGGETPRAQRGHAHR